MNIIRITLKVLKIELLYQHFSKNALLMIIVLLFVSFFNISAILATINNEYIMYEQTKERHISNGYDIETLLRSDLIVDRQNGGVHIDNPVKYHFLETASAISSMNPKNISATTMEVITFIFCTVLFSIYGSHIATYDFTNSSLKVKSINYGIYNVIVGKLLSIFTVILFVLFVVLLTNYFSSFFLENFIPKSIPIENFELDILKYESNIFTQFLFCYFVSCYFALLGFFIGFIFKNRIIPIILFLSYSLAVPILGRFDPRNIIAYIAHNIFIFKGKFKLMDAIDVDPFFGILLLCIVFIILLFFTLLISRKRSIYN